MPPQTARSRPRSYRLYGWAGTGLVPLRTETEPIVQPRPVEKWYRNQRGCLLRIWGGYSGKRAYGSQGAVDSDCYSGRVFPVRPPRKGLGPVPVDLTDFEWNAIAPALQRKVRGIKRVDDRRVLNGILWRLRTGLSWAAVPDRYGAPGTCQARFVRWRDAGVWDKILDAVVQAYAGEVELIEASATFVPPRFGRAPSPSGDPVAWRRRSRSANRNVSAAYPTNMLPKPSILQSVSAAT